MKNIGPNDADADIYKPSWDLSIYFNDNIDGCMYLRWIFILIPILQYIIQRSGNLPCNDPSSSLLSLVPVQPGDCEDVDVLILHPQDSVEHFENLNGVCHLAAVH